MLDRKITVVSNNAETLDGTQLYLQRVGAYSVMTSRLEEATRTADGSEAIVLFADDYPREDALHTFNELCVSRPHAVLIVVTEDVETFVPPRRTRHQSSRVVVLRRPAWGWMLVDAIRSRTIRDTGAP